MMYKAVKNNGTSTSWFELVWDLPLQGDFYYEAGHLYGTSSADGKTYKHNIRGSSLSDKDKNKKTAVLVEKFAELVEKSKHVSLFEKVSIPRHIWSDMEPIRVMKNKDLVQCQELCDKEEECNMFQLSATKTCRLTYVSKNQ